MQVNGTSPLLRIQIGKVLATGGGLHIQTPINETISLVRSFVEKKSPILKGHKSIKAFAISYLHVLLGMLGNSQCSLTFSGGIVIYLACSPVCSDVVQYGVYVPA